MVLYASAAAREGGEFGVERSRCVDFCVISASNHLQSLGECRIVSVWEILLSKTNTCLYKPKYVYFCDVQVVEDIVHFVH